jgi:hypothetical protein
MRSQIETNALRLILTLLLVVDTDQRLELDDDYKVETVKIRQLQGRPLLLTQGGDGSLRRAKVSSENMDAQKQYLVRVKRDLREVIYTALQEYSVYIQYLPHDTFLVVMEARSLTTIKRLNGVLDIFMMPHMLKISDRISLKAQTSRSKVATETNNLTNSPRKTISVLTTPSSTDANASLLCKSAGVECSARRDSDAKCTVSVAEASLAALLRDIARHPWVLWVEEHLPKRLHNGFATGLVQSSDWSVGTSRLLWDRGLTGEGEIIGRPHERSTGTGQCTYL